MLALRIMFKHNSFPESGLMIVLPCEGLVKRKTQEESSWKPRSPNNPRAIRC